MSFARQTLTFALAMSGAARVLEPKKKRREWLGGLLALQFLPFSTKEKNTFYQCVGRIIVKMTRMERVAHT